METEPGNLLTVMHHLRTLVSQIKPEGDISFGEFCVLSMIETEFIEFGRKLTPTRLNIMLGTKKPATSRLLAVLEKKGYVEKIGDISDGRIYYIELTTEGKNILEMERESFHSLMARVSSRLGDEEIKQITKSLDHFSNILEEELEGVTN